MASIGDIFLRLGIEDSGLEAEITRKATTAADKAGAKAGATMGSRMAKGLTTGLTAIGGTAGVAFTAAVGAAGQFEDQLRTINTVAGLTDSELQGVGKSILDLSRETGKSTDDLTAGFYDLVSAGVSADDAVKVLKDSAVFATGALGTTGEAVDLVTSALNAYGLEANQSTRVTDIFAKAVADGKVTAAQLGSSLAQIAPIAASSGVSLEEVSAGYALLTAKGVPAAQAATQMRAAISALLTPNKQLNDIQKETGINFRELADQKGLVVALEALRKATNGNEEAFAKALGSVEALNFATITTGDSFNDYQTELNGVTEAANKGGVAQGQYEERMKSAKSQADKFLAGLHAMAIEFGGPFVNSVGPAVLALGQFGMGLGSLFNLSKAVGGAIGALAGRIAAKFGLKLGAAIASQATEPVAEGVADAVTKAGRSTKVSGATGKLGKFLGTKLGTGLAVAFAAVAVVEVAKTFIDIQNGLNEQARTIGEKIGQQLVGGTTDELQRSRAALQTAMDKLKSDWLNPFAPGQFKNLKEQADAIDAELQRRASELGSHVPKATADGIASTSGVMRDAAKDAIYTPIVDQAQKAAMQAAIVAGKTPAEVAANLDKNRGAVDAAMERLRQAIVNPTERAKERARVVGLLTGKELASALHSSNPAIKREAELARDTLEDQLRLLTNNSGKHGKATMDALNAALHSKNPEVRKEAERIKAILEERFRATNAKGIATQKGQDVATGLDSKAGTVRQSADAVRGHVEDRFDAIDGRTPGQTAGRELAQALNSGDVRGQINRVVTSLASFINTLFGRKVHPKINVTGNLGVSGARAEGGPVTAGSSYLVGERGPELFVPQVSGTVVPNGDTPSTVAGNTTYNIPVTVQGTPQVYSPVDIAREVARFARNGLLPERNVPMRWKPKDGLAGG